MLQDWIANIMCFEQQMQILLLTWVNIVMSF